MIKIKIGNGDRETDIRFPISESELYDKLTEIHAIDSSDVQQPVTVTGIYWPEEFSVLEGCQVDLDEMNYLAKRLDSFDDREMDQFLIGISMQDEPSLKNLINLTFNIDHFTLVQDVSNYGKIGRAYVMNTEGAVPANDEDDPKYAAIAKRLIDRGLARITAKGLLIYDPFDKLTEVYDGQTFPEYAYDSTLASAEVSYGGRTELLQLPDEELAIKKAIARLGAPSDSDCSFSFYFNYIKNDAWEKRMDGIIRSEGIYEANTLLRALDADNMDLDKLTAAAEYADVDSTKDLIALAEHIGDFIFIKDAEDYETVGRYFAETDPKYDLNLELEDFFDFNGFGEYLAEANGGEFISSGFVCMQDGAELSEILDSDEDMTMGGM